MASKSNVKYQMRLFAIISSFTWILTFAFFVLQYSREREYKVQELNAHMQLYNTDVLNALSQDKVFAHDFIEKRAKKDSIRVTILDFKGNVTYDTDNDSVYMNHGDRKEYKDAMLSGHGFTVRRLSKTDKKEYFYSATKGDSVVVRSAVPYDGYLINELSVDWIYSVIIIVMAIVVNIIAYFAIRKIGQTVKSLSDFAEKAEKGELNPDETYEFPQDELGDISSHIVNMYLKQEATQKECDASVKAMIFEEQEKNRIKHQLTNNMNHEIKTPVHVIQACLETIVNNADTLDKETQASLIDKAYGNVKQLCSLLQDISIITRISEASDKIECNPVNINAIVENVAMDIDVYPPNKRMRFHIDIPDNLVINGNESLLSSVFHNLVNNALAYSGGRDMYLKMIEETDEYYKFEFSDNGIGVEPEHLSRLFERFYRVDTGRSRKMGGTGLGLSIVKNAVLFHNGTISVNNRPSGGLQFIFTLHK